nr:GGDEF domain-containing protein [Lachnospiraceae bacterium]
SMSDKLTDLYNRLGYHNFAVNMFRRSHETGERLGVLFMDMDKLKYINDTFGHACGDDAIRSIATSVKNSIPAEAVPVRYGGDEILVITPIDKDEDMEEIVNRIHEDIPKTARGFNLPVLPDVSAGYVITDPGSPLTLEEYVEEADKLMYNEKLLKRVERG